MPEGRAPSGLRGPAAAGAVAQVFVADLGSPEPEPDDAHHLSRVLRLRPGEKVVASDGRGGWVLCAYTAASHPSKSLEPISGTEHEPRAERPAWVGFVPVKGDKPEWVVQKLTELGVDHIALLTSSRSVVRWDERRSERAMERLALVSKAAAAQSRRSWLPMVEGPWSLEEFGSHAAPVPLAVAEPGAPPLDAQVAVAVGPEGGWDPTEVEGRRRVGLGETVLRSETAAMAAAALLRLGRF